jgi:hypothetical protein
LLSFIELVVNKRVPRLLGSVPGFVSEALERIGA